MQTAGEPEEARGVDGDNAENRLAEEDTSVNGRDDGEFRTASTCCPSPAEEVQDRAVEVGILGATGVVGQHFVSLLHGHPWFRVVAVSGSARTAGLKYGEVTKWHLADMTPLAAIKDMEVLACDAGLFKARRCALVFSALTADVAEELEKTFAEAGIWVFSNARSWRGASCVPILLPFVNSEHLDLVLTQTSYKEAGGGIVTNGNCAGTGLAVALAPIFQTWGIERVVVATLQACSGAGYPGESALDMIDNLVPHIAGEEEKLEWEPQKILGKLRYSDGINSSKNGGEPLHRTNASTVSDTPAAPGPDKNEPIRSPRAIFIEPAPFESYAMCHRVPVTEGHTMSVVIDLPAGAVPPTACTLCVADAVEWALEHYKPPEVVRRLPSCPQQTLLLLDHVTRPQPRLDRMQGAGMSVSVGPVKAVFSRQRQAWTLKLTLVVHNTILGAGGCSILNAELALIRGLVKIDHSGRLLRPSQPMKNALEADSLNPLLKGRARVATFHDPAPARKKHCQAHIADGVANTTLSPSKG